MGPDFPSFKKSVKIRSPANMLRVETQAQHKADAIQRSVILNYTQNPIHDDEKNGSRVAATNSFI